MALEPVEPSGKSQDFCLFTVHRALRQPAPGCPGCLWGRGIAGARLKHVSDKELFEVGVRYSMR